MNLPALRALALLAGSLFFFVACGGGGGGDKSSPPPAPPPPPAAQTITFATAGPVDRILGDAAFTNAASGGAGTGAISYSSSNTAVATVDASGTVTMLGVGNTVITASKAASTGFLAATANYTLNVGAPPPPPVAQTIAFADIGPVDKLLGDAPFTNAAGGGAGTGAITYSSSATNVATVNANTGQVTILATGVTTITANKAASAGYLAATASYILNVSLPPPVAQTITFANPGPVLRTAGDPPFTNTASGGAGTGAITYSSSNTAVATVGLSSGQVTAISAGTAIITANKAASAGYLAASASYTLNVDAAPLAQTIAFDPPGPIAKVYGDPPFAHWASGTPNTGSGAITYASNTPSVATVNATTGWVTVVGAGTAIITATKAASAGYLSATANYTLNVARAPQTIAFHYPGPLSKRPYDNDFINPARGGDGNGDIEYTSSDSSVAMVNGPRGEIHVVGVGTATITANKAQSANHLAASASYLVNVATRPTSPMHAWMTYDESLVKFPPGAVGAQWLRGDFTNCTDNNFESCPVAPVSTLIMQDVNDVEAELFQPVIHSLQGGGFTTRPTVIDGAGYRPIFDNEVVEENGTLWSLDFNQALLDRSNDGRAWTSSSSPMPYGPREGASAVGFDNKIWVIGGNQMQATAQSPAVGEKADVFEIDTRGGAGFVTQTAAFGARKFHRVVSFDGRLWLIGGMRGTPAQYLNDIWSSADGQSWTRVTAAAPFAPRAEHSLTVFAGRLWVIAGRNSGGYLNDVWSSFDGVNWQLESSFGNHGRAGHRAVVHNSRLHVIGRAEFLDYFVYSTVDGVSWQHHDPVDVATWNTRFAAVAFRNRLWMFGGTDQPTGSACCARGDVWSSTDANTWRYEGLGSPFSSMPGANLWKFNNQLYLTASSTHTHHQSMRPYRTSDVIDWTVAEPPTPIQTQAIARSHQVMLDYNNRLYLIGGRNLQPGTFPGGHSDVYSTDGSTWTLHTNHAFLTRYGHSGYVINGRMFVLGGWEETPLQLGDIHSSTDGTNWRTDVATSTNIGLRSYHKTVVFNNRVWLLGGQKNGTGVTGEIWSSADGINWQLEKAHEPATARMMFGATVMFNRIFVAGGVDANGNLVSDVWSSFDGVTWSLRTPAALPTPRAHIALAEMDNRLYLFGGESTDAADLGRGVNEMWMSPNGERWFRLYRNEMEIP